MAPTGTAGGTARVRFARCYQIVEDVVYIGLSVLLAGIVVMLLVGTLITFARSALSWSLPGSISKLLDQILLILLLLELLYTVKPSFHEHALAAEPFLLVGLISAIRRVLVLTAVMGEAHGTGAAQPPTQPIIAELAVLAALILALAISLVVLRRRNGRPNGEANGKRD